MSSGQQLRQLRQLVGGVMRRAVWGTVALGRQDERADTRGCRIPGREGRHPGAARHGCVCLGVSAHPHLLPRPTHPHLLPNTAIVRRYMADEARSLKAYGELPENSECCSALACCCTLRGAARGGVGQAVLLMARGELPKNGELPRLLCWFVWMWTEWRMCCKARAASLPHLLPLVVLSFADWSPLCCAHLQSA